MTLDGTLSVDPNDGPVALTYSWEQQGGPSVTSLVNELAAEPSFIVPAATGATLTFNLTVFDGLDSDWDLVNVNIRLVAAPDDGDVMEGDLVPLVAQAADLPGRTVTWSDESDVPVAFDNGNVHVLSTVFQAPEVDEDTPVTLRITTSNGNGTISGFDEVTFTVHDNEAPIADAGLDLPAVGGGPAGLDGSASDDNETDPLDYLWTAPSSPTGIIIVDPTVAQPTVILPAVTTAKVATFRLTVTDPTGAIGQDTVDVLILPAGPLHANAGPDQTVLQGTTVLLSGGASTGPIATNGYAWSAIGTAPMPTPSRFGHQDLDAWRECSQLFRRALRSGNVP